MAGGRPRTVTPPPEECIKLGEDLIAWLHEEKRLHLSGWWALKQGMLRKEWEALKMCPEFLEYYEKAKAYMVHICLDGTIKEGFGHRYLRLYDRELIDEENAQKKWESDLKSKENEKVGAEFFEKADLFLNQIDRLQQARQKAED